MSDSSRLSVEFQPTKLLGKDWTMMLGLFSHVSCGAVLLPATAEYRGKLVSFEFPAEIKDGTLESKMSGDMWSGILRELGANQ